MRSLGLALLACGIVPTALVAGEADAVSHFREQVAPILVSRCLRCHQGKAPKGDVDLSRARSVIEGRGEGSVVVPGKPEESLLLEVVSGEKPTMPRSGARLSAPQVEALREWIAAGAPWPEEVVLKADPRDWWSLRPLGRPEPPALEPADRGWARTPVDAFVLAKLRARGLRPAAEADRQTMIRRLTFDLTGLPPTPEEVDAFLTDHRPDAYERLVDRLLASPHYGERWGRHWLDVVHYGDTHGYDKDKLRPNAWPYRDYVIRAFNEDRPFGRFAREQVAGDVLYPGTRDGIEALGFLAAGPWDFIGHAEVPETKVDGQVARMLDRDDMVANTLNTFVSLTVQCARCHDHKFDPVAQEDYYSLQAVFAALDRADRTYDLDPAAQSRRDALAARRLALVAEVNRLRRAGGEAGERYAAAKQALADVEREIKSLPAGRLVYCATIHDGSGSFRGTGPDGGRPRVVRVLARGDVRDPRQVVGPGTVPLVDGLPARFDLPPEAPEGQRRAALAGWITDRRNPLFWRSIANRVWQYHFGRGIADSPNDFGRMGQEPSHPELLDWLAVELRDGGESLKRLHRLIILSSTYRQSCTSDPRAAAIDGGNALLWRMHRRRLEAEEVRDAVLAVAGRLDPRMGGPGFHDFVIEHPEHSPHYEYRRFDPEDPASHRRAIYRFIVRSQPQPFLATLDCADASMSVDRRNESLTALHALALRNNRFMLVMSAHLAARLERHAREPGAQVDYAFRLALGRPPAADERAAMVAYARRFGLANLSRVIFNLNEFVFVD